MICCENGKGDTAVGFCNTNAATDAGHAAINRLGCDGLVSEIGRDLEPDIDKLPRLDADRIREISDAYALAVTELDSRSYIRGWSAVQLPTSTTNTQSKCGTD